jgi:hypothetical protein
VADRLWIRFEQYDRFHAVRQADRQFLTVCGAHVRPETVHEQSSHPPKMCRCCRLRLQRPYLMPPIERVNETC